MKENIGDKIVYRILKRKETVTARILEQYKGVKPFRKLPISDDESLIQYNMMTPQDLDKMIQTDGVEKTNSYIRDMEALKARRMK